MNQDGEKARKELEDAASEARTGGLIGSGAKGHRRALRNDLEVKNP